MSFARAQVKLMRAVSLVDLLLLAGLVAFIYGMVGVAMEWVGPHQRAFEIDLNLFALPGYAFFSLVRGFVAYGLSLLFTLSYGYLAAHSRRAETVLIPLLDILQSIPVLGFLPGLVLALVPLFPGSNVGLELSCILMIFTGQVWNMTFSFYTSVRNVPIQMREVSSLYRLNRWDVLRKLEIPYAMNGLLWNSMLSMAGGWFFLMVAESFTLGDQDYRLPGIGSYMAVAIEKGETQAIVAGMLAMVLIIVLVDRCLWAPLVHWSSKFKSESQDNPPPLVIKLLERSSLLRNYYRLMEEVARRRERRSASKKIKGKSFVDKFPWRVFLGGLRWGGFGVVLVGFYFGAIKLYEFIGATSVQVWLRHLEHTFYTFLRVTGAVVLGSLWAIPAGVFIGTHSTWTRRLQPVVQVVAAFPAPMIYPMVTYLFLSLGIPFEIGAVFLMLLGAQWYILFNVISGATLIPTELVDVAKVFRVEGLGYWKAVIFPTIFPSLVSGWITAAGGAWNASIVSEFMRYGETTHLATGIGASITKAAEAADYPVLAGGILTMVTALILMNRLFWDRLYRLAKTRYRLEM